MAALTITVKYFLPSATLKTVEVMNATQTTDKTLFW